MIKKPRSKMSLYVIGGLVGLLVVLGLVVANFGCRAIAEAIMHEHSVATYHMADMSSVYVNGDHIDSYLAGENQEEYAFSKMMLGVSCQKMNVSIIYVIKVDTSDYGRFVSIFNLVNNSVDNTDYTEWELGHQRDTTNDKYREKYKAIYEEGAAYETVFRMKTTDGQKPHVTTMVPVKNSAGEVSAILCIQRPIREMAEVYRPYVLKVFGGVLIMVLLVSLLTGIFLSREVITPVETISEEAGRFAKEHKKGQPMEGLGIYDVILDLAASIESMETDMVNYMDDLTKATAEKERMSAELSIAATIQKDALPDVFPPFPDRHEFDIYASMDPAKEVGGDFYNFFLIDDDHLALIMADVSGKGIPAALFMMQTNLMLSGRILMGGSPSEILRFANDNICRHNKADMFVTIWLGILEISTGHVIAANAGHEMPAIYRKDGRFELVNTKHGFVVGGMEGISYKDYELQLNKGDKLFLYTDGVPEATDSKNQMYTTDRMIKALNEYKEESPEKILDGLRQSINAFVGDADQFDDLTMLCIEIKEED